MTYNDDYDRQEDALKAADRAAAGEAAGHPGARSLQDKAAINAGLSHDKVAGVDLATSPLGTDAEAGGGRAEAGRPPPAAEGSASRDPNRANAVRPPAPWIWIVIGVIAAVAVGAFLLLGLT
jgi:cytochrome c-type biogenesis protein CcmH/NrfG